MVFREAKSLARTLAPLVKKSDALAWMKPFTGNLPICFASMPEYRGW
jgi:hypothetical protein